MGFLLENCTFCELSAKLIQECESFCCSKESDIDEFFHDEFDGYQKNLLSKSYCFVTETIPHRIACAFTVANANIKVDILTTRKRNRINRSIPNPKRKSQYPAVLVGQLAVFDGFHGMNIGDELMDFIKSWFIDPLNKTGRRYVIVDAINKEKVIAFYQKNGFEYMFNSDKEEMLSLKNDTLLEKDLEDEYKKTRLMYFDLLLLKGK